MVIATELSQVQPLAPTWNELRQRELSSLKHAGGHMTAGLLNEAKAFDRGIKYARIALRTARTKKDLEDAQSHLKRLTQLRPSVMTKIKEKLLIRGYHNFSTQTGLPL